MRLWKSRVEKMVDAATTGAVATGAQNQAEVPLGESSGVGFVFRFLRKDKAALIGMAIIGAFFAFAAVEGLLQIVGGYMRLQSLGWLLLPSNPLQVNFHHSLDVPSLNSLASILGYDYEGRSILSQILYAAPRDAMAAVLVVGSAILIGMLLGITAGYVGGWADEILMRTTDAFLAFPVIFLAIALAILLGNGYTVVLVALVVIWWPPYARFFRAQTLRERNRGYVEASKLSGISSLRIMSRHIFPNTIDPIIAIASLDLGNVILTYSTLAFLGIGLQIGIPEWGSMTSDGLAYVPGAWWWTLFPALAIMLVVVCFSIIGDRIQDLVGGRLSY
jgi:peptide/nickel transport system permease protein